MRWISLLLCFAASLAGAGFSTNAAARVVGMAPLPSIAAFEKANNIPLGKIDALLTNDVVKPGDSVTVLVTLTEKDAQRTQWLLHTKIAGHPAASNGVMVIHNTFGNKFEFTSHPSPPSFPWFPFVKLLSVLASLHFAFNQNLESPRFLREFPWMARSRRRKMLPSGTLPFRSRTRRIPLRPLRKTHRPVSPRHRRKKAPPLHVRQSVKSASKINAKTRRRRDAKK